ncbi:MAG: hypothetical protein L0Z62_00035, partial [Gemmataceae bacterium]|nr:hypothetical protein [Gemmataceae bacterium]
MANTCAHCSRINPAEAAYCYFDGSALNSRSHAGPVNVGSMRFPAPFTFPSGRSCSTFDQFALACQEEWAVARDLLRNGTLERFLGSLGRVDLALAAHTAADFPDSDRALDQFLERLPTQAVPPPKLAVEPAEVNLGTLPGPADQQFELLLTNSGGRLLYGAVVADCKWLTLGPAPGNAQKLFQVARSGAVTVNVRPQHLRAGPPQEGRLIVESNGGRVEVTVRAALTANRFPEGLLAGATTPRELAEKARTAPKQAAAFFENGSVERWYQSNGWPYPVKGARASGLGAVQQFFEALGLAKPPKVELSEEVLSLRGRPGEALRQTLQVKATEKRPVYASAASDQGWLVVGQVQLTGSVATIPLEVNPVPGEPGTVLQARVRITANGGQTFIVPVSLAVGQAAGSDIKAATVATVAPLDTDIARPTGRKTKPVVTGQATTRKKARAARVEEDDEDEPEGSGKKYLLVGGLLLLLLLLLGGGLWLALGGLSGSGKVEVAVQDEPEEKKAPRGPPVFKVQEEDEPVEVIHAVLPIKHQIQDEPEERTKPQAEPPIKVEIRDEPEEVQPGKGKDGAAPIDPEPRVQYQYDKHMHFGITALKDPFGRPLNKRLTYSPNGGTNNTRIRVNGVDAELDEPAGRWLVRA